MKTQALEKHAKNKKQKRILFLKNKAGELLKTKGNGKKQTENKPKTKLLKLLKTQEAPKNKPKTNRKTKRAIFLKIKDSKKTNRKMKQKSGSDTSTLQYLEKLVPYFSCSRFLGPALEHSSLSASAVAAAPINIGSRQFCHLFQRRGGHGFFRETPKGNQVPSPRYLPDCLPCLFG